MEKLLPEKVFERLKISKGMNILDFGCGSGEYTIPIAKTVGNLGKVYGLDKDINELQRLQKKAEKERLTNVETILGNESINLDKGSIDIVLLFDVLHYVNSKKKLLKNLYNMLKFNGVLFVFPHYHFSKEKLIETISQGGFFVLKDEYPDEALYNFKKRE